MARPSLQKEESHRAGDVDQGWAWVVLAGVCLWNAVISGALKSIGLIYLGYVDLFNQGDVATGWLGSSFSITLAVSAAVGGCLCDRVSIKRMRWAVMVCAGLSSACVVGVAMAPSLPIAITFYGLAGGFYGSVDGYVLSLLVKFFRKRRFLASAIAFSMASLGGMVIPSCFVALDEEYGTRGAMLVFSAIWLNSVLVGATIIKGETTIVEIGMQDRELDILSGRLAHDTNVVSEHSRYPFSASSQRGKVEIEPQAPTNADGARKLSDGGRQTNICMTVLQGTLSLFKLRGVSSLTAMFFFSTFAYFNQFFILPIISDEISMDKQLAGFLLSTVSLTEIFTRIICGVLIDKGIVSDAAVLYISFSVSFCLGIAVSFTRTAWLLFGYAAFFGAVGGASVPLFVPMMAKRVGLDKMATVGGILALLVGCGSFAGPPLITSIGESTETYFNSLRLVVTSYLFALALFLLTQYGSNCRRSKQVNEGRTCDT